LKLIEGRGNPMPLDREKLSDMKLKADLATCQGDVAELLDALKNLYEQTWNITEFRGDVEKLWDAKDQAENLMEKHHTPGREGIADAN
jgi:hypothetical protein